MKTRFALPLLLVCASTINAQEGMKWVALQGAYTVPRHGETQDLSDNNFGFGAQGGWWVTNRCALDLSLFAQRFKFEKKFPGESGTGTQVMGSMLINYWQGEKGWLPFVRFGAGLGNVPKPFLVRDKDQWRPLFAVGTGLQIFPGERFFGSAEVRYVRLGANWRVYQTWQYLASAGVRWGGEHKP